MRSQEVLAASVAELQRRGFRVAATADYAQVVVYDLPLPRDRGQWTDTAGREIATVAVSFSVPWDFPYMAPGVGFAHPQNAIHIPRIQFRDRDLSNLHPCQHDPWHWLCFQRLDWDPAEGTLATLVNTVTFSILDRAGYLG